MHNQFEELGKNGKKHGYILQVFIDHETACDLEIISKICNTTPACIAHNMIIQMIEWENKLGQIASLNKDYIENSDDLPFKNE